MIIQLIGKKSYDFFDKDNNNKHIVGARLYGLVVDPVNDDVEGQEVWTDSFASVQAFDLVVGENYNVYYDKLRDGKAKLAALVLAD